MSLMPKFEVVVYNREVRELVEIGERHKNLSDNWADLHYLEVTAGDENEARSKMETKYPPAQGYVIESISPVKKDEY
ncbi:MAG: hypothetical protein V3R66_00580 [Rhodospirillales bacterium]